MFGRDECVQRRGRQAPGDLTLSAVPRAQAAFDLDAALATSDGFYRMPFPSDLRLSAAGKPVLAGFVGSSPS